MILEILLNMASWAFIITGSAFVLIGSVGFFRFPDFWSRLHAASVIDSGGMMLIVVGMCLQAGLTLITVKLLLILIFLVITGPTATHAIANAALVAGLGLRTELKGRKDQGLKVTLIK